MILPNLAACIEQRAPQASPDMNLGTAPVIAVRAAPFQTRPHFEEPLRGTAAGAGKGAKDGLSATGDFCSGMASAGSGGAFIFVPLCIASLPVTVVIGSLYGRAASRSKTEVIAATTALKKVIKNAKPATAIEDALIAQLKSEFADDAVIRKFIAGPETLTLEDLAKEGIDMLIELQISRLDLGVFGKIDPDASVFLEIRGTVIKTEEQADVFPSTWQYHSARKNYFELAAEDGKKLKEIIQQSYGEIAHQIVRDMILRRN